MLPNKKMFALFDYLNNTWSRKYVNVHIEKNISFGQPRTMCANDVYLNNVTYI